MHHTGPRSEFERWWARLLRQGTSPAGAIALIDLYREIDVRPILPMIRGQGAVVGSGLEFTGHGVHTLKGAPG